jgi:hypothetical protein
MKNVLLKSANIQSVSRLLGITAGGDFLGLCIKKSSYKHVSDFGRLQSSHLMTRVTRVQTRRRSSNIYGRKIQGTSPPGGTLSCLTRVINLLHVKEPQAPRGPLSKIIGHFPSKSFGRGLAMSGSLIQGVLPIVEI